MAPVGDRRDHEESPDTTSRTRGDADSTLLEEDCVDIVVKGRNVEVPDHYRELVREKLALSERLDSRVHRLDVELSHEKNPRQSDRCQRVEITCHSKGPVIRAEACAADFYAALDAAVLKLEARLRKSHDRRRVHHGGKTPVSVAEVTASLPSDLSPAASDNGAVAVLDREAESLPEDDTDLLIARDKTHDAQPMTSTQALHEMELVGHDFFLFVDADSGLPSVVYRRHGYDYGVIRVQASA